MTDLENRIETREDIETSVLYAIKEICGKNFVLDYSIPLSEQMHELELLLIVSILGQSYIIQKLPSSKDISTFENLVEYVLRNKTPIEDREKLYDREAYLSGISD